MKSSRPAARWRWPILLLCLAPTLWLAVAPFGRAFYRMEVNYNEGWNVYNASIVAAHQLLYPVKFGWTMVNYPMLSFVVLAKLHSLTHDYLFTSRILSLLSLVGLCVLVGMILRRLGATPWASALGAIYCLALFVHTAGIYVGMDDPQMFAMVFFAGGLLVYMRRRESNAAIAIAALLFVIGGSIKQNPIDFPLAVLLDLLLVSRRRALWFSVCGILLAGIAVALNLHFGGPSFLAQQVAARGYSRAKIFLVLSEVFGHWLIPLLIAFYAAFLVRRDKQCRIAILLLATSLLLGGYFSGGSGVSINAYFSALVATAILTGLFFSKIETADTGWVRSPLALAVPLVVFIPLLRPVLFTSQTPLRVLRDSASAEQRFGQQVAFLRSRPGPALCESLLRCFYADKPYVYDPFNATRLVNAGKLDPSVIVDQIQKHQYGAIQFDKPSDSRDDHWPPPIYAAIQKSYVPAFDDQDGVIYVPAPSSLP